jgi:RES domain
VSSTTWTPTEVESEQVPWQGALWRAVEAQHRVSTLRLVDTLEEQAQLEALLDESKPVAPALTRPLHYLLTTPFRYLPSHTGGSRFRSVADPGVFYGADTRRTACAELGYWRWRFLLDSPNLSRLEPLPQTLFQCEVNGRTIDLTALPFNRDEHLWASPTDYTACQELAKTARAAHTEVIRYQSVRDAPAGRCAAVLTPRALMSTPLLEQTWHLSVTRDRIQWRRDSVLVDEHFEFTADSG